MIDLINGVGPMLVPPSQRGNIDWAALAQDLVDLGHPLRTNASLQTKFRQMENAYKAIKIHKTGTGM